MSLCNLVNIANSIQWRNARPYEIIFQNPTQSQNCNLFLQVKLQELAEHVPKGHIPRSLTAHLRGELTRKVKQVITFLSL
jgi:hypothetical protein